MKERIIDVNYTESDKKYSTIEEVSNILSIDAPTIVFWCNKFNNLLNIQSIGMYQIFSENDIKNLKTIKKLNIDDNMNIGEIKTYLNQNTGIIISKKEIEVPEVSLLTVIAKILTSQNEKIEMLIDSQNKMIEFNQQILLNQETFMNKLNESQKETCIDLENKTNEIKEIITDKFSVMEKEFNTKNIEREDNLKYRMQIRKLQQDLLDIESQKKKSLWSKFLGK